MRFESKILKVGFITHDVKRFIITRPEGLNFTPGQGVELAIDDDKWREEGRPFTPTSLPEDPVLEFVIKGYPQHNGVTQRLHAAKAGDRLLISEAFGTISYKGSGTFIAAGAGITPFLAIIGELSASGQLEGNSLLYSNKIPDDIIEEALLRNRFGNHAHFFCSRECDCRCNAGRIDRMVLERYIDNFDQRFYVCGPPPFTESINQALHALGAQTESVVFEQ